MASTKTICFCLLFVFVALETVEAKWNYPLNQTIHDCWQCITFSKNWKEERCDENKDKFTCRDGTLACMKIVRPLPQFDSEKLGLKNVVIRACYPANGWIFMPLGENETPHHEEHTHNAVFTNPRVTTKALCWDLIEAHISRYSWLSEFSDERYRNYKIQGVYSNLTREEALEQKRDWEELCENMDDTDITEGPDSKRVLRCKDDLCNFAAKTATSVVAIVVAVVVAVAVGTT